MVALTFNPALTEAEEGIWESKASLIYTHVQVGQGYKVRPSLLNGSTVRENCSFREHGFNSQHLQDRSKLCV